MVVSLDASSLAPALLCPVQAEAKRAIAAVAASTTAGFRRFPDMVVSPEEGLGRGRGCAYVR
jgi:hypothetical protein